jgi:lipopolysaccharide transport system permease protein
MSNNVQEIQNIEDQKWDKIIRPKRNLLDLRLKELWRYRDLVMLFVRRDFVSVYKQTILGPLWFLIQPLLTTITFTVIFGNIAKLPTDGLPQFLFYMSGTVIWTYFSDCLTKTSNTFVSNSQLFGKVYFPRMSVPVSILISSLITFAIQFALFLVFMGFFALHGTVLHPNWWILFSPVLILMMAGLGLGFGVIISSLTTKYRDLRFLVQFGVQLLMYATPVIYPVSSIPARFQPLIVANPMTSIVETFRYAFLGAGTVNPLDLLYSFVFMVVVVILGAIIFNRVEATFMDTV